MCELMHFYRYFMRLETRRYEEKQALIIGSIVHDAIEAIYKLNDPDISHEKADEVVREMAQKVIDEYREEANRAYFCDDYQFELDCHVALSMVWLFCQKILPDDSYELVGTEVPFDITIAGERFIGFKDQVFKHRETGAVAVGEVKTWSSSRPTNNLDAHVIGDLQTDIYLLALSRSGKADMRKVYTVYKKPPAKYLKRENYESLEEHKKAIDGYYRRARTAVTRSEIDVDIDEGSIEKRVGDLLERINDFYKDPYQRAANHHKPGENTFPCFFCEYRHLCYEGAAPGADFTYKKERQV